MVTSLDLVLLHQWLYYFESDVHSYSLLQYTLKPYLLLEPASSYLHKPSIPARFNP